MSLYKGESPIAELSMLKVLATETMEFCAREAMQMLGGAGFIRGHRVERIYREVRIMAIGGGSAEIMRDLTARQMGVLRNSAICKRSAGVSACPYLIKKLTKPL